MCSRRQIAKDWGVVKSYVDKCVTQRGCPTSSLEAAREWRKRNAMRRAPTNSKLISLSKAKAIAFASYDYVLDLVDTLPEYVAARCNAADSQATLDVLKDECLAVFCRAGDVYGWWANDGITGVTGSASVMLT
jgi:hypothetical protein